MAQAGVIRNFMVALGFKTDKSEADAMKKTLEDVEVRAKILNKALLGLAAGAVFAVQKTASALDKLHFSSQLIGASVTNINAYGNAIAQLGGSAEGAVGTLESLAEKIRNSPGYESQIKGLGVATRDATGQMRDRVEVMKDLSGVLAKMPAYQANAYAQSLGIDQNTLLAMRDGKFMGNMEKYQKIQKELGMNDDLAKSGNEFMTEYRDLTMMTKTGFQVIVMQAGKALIPVLRLLNQLIQAGISAFSQLNPQIKEGLAIGLRFAMLALVFNALFKSLIMLKTGLGVLKLFIPSLRALGLAFMGTPFGWITGLIVALAAALGLLYDDYKTWKEGGKSLFDWSKWTNGIDTIIKKVKDFLAILNEVKDKTIEFVQKIINDPAGALKDVVDAGKDAINHIINPDKAPDTPRPEPLNETVKSINEASKTIVDGARNMVGSVMDMGKNLLGSDAGKAATAVAQAVDAAVVNGVVKGVNGVTGAVGARSGKALNLTEQDIIDIIKVTSTEVVPGLKGINFEQQAAGVIDTILNRTASGKYGNSVQDVVNKRWAFSDINTPRKSAYGSVRNVPMSRVSKRMEAFARQYIEDRAQGKSSIIGSNVSYANPNFLGEATEDTKKWVREVEAQASKTGQRFGAGKAIHVHGTPGADKDKMPPAFYIVTPSSIKSGSQALADFAQNADMPNIQSFAPPMGNPHKGQVNNSSAMTASNIVINQNYKTDMTLNGVSNPVDAANAVKRQQENSLTVMARGAKGALVG